MSAKSVPLSQADLPKHHESKCLMGRQWMLWCNGLNFWMRHSSSIQLYLPSATGLVSQHQPNFCCMDFVFELCFPNLDSSMA